MATSIPNGELDRCLQAAHLLGLDEDGAHAMLIERYSIPADEADNWRGAVELRLGQLRVTEPAASKIEFLSWDGLHDAAPDEPNWAWDGYIARESVTLAAGKPKAGKSTLVCALSEAIDANAASFLGRPITGGPVIYISEEAGVTLKPKLSRSTKSRVLTRDLIWPRPTWTALIDAAVAEAREIEAVLLVIDSYVFWAQLAEGQENDGPLNQSMIASLVAAANAGLAVILVHHHRKSGGEQGDAVRGSGGIFAAVDALVEVERIENAPKTNRAIYAVGRFPNMPAATVVDLDMSTGGWSVIGEADDRREIGDRTRRQTTREALLEVLPFSGVGLTSAEIHDAVDEDKREVDTALRDLLREGHAQRAGKGVRGHPYFYTRRLSPESSHTAGDKAGTNVSPIPPIGNGRNETEKIPGLGGGESSEEGEQRGR